ncbi:hypothetical protein POF51_26470 [Brevibacillus sp. AG]|uniref:hypothetical protein n=1 Tax=Brevibacillus sp. AG TaxID=3020891 RepID=UPI00232D519A|nr:hypothetical protein [Brevibacillus sp. AG]MDC0764269.1 hypothetical protein [Brevibacillus sp. AG]
MNRTIRVDVPEQRTKTPLQRKVERLLTKAEKQGYQFNEIELSMFRSLGRENWEEEKVNWLALQQFDQLYARFYPK